MKKFIEKFRLVSFKDIIALLFIFPAAYVVSLFYKKRNSDLILICESEDEARDNGYWLFKYIVEHYPNENVAYAINFKSAEANKVLKLGNCVDYGSFKHWVYYLSAGLNVSTQKGGKPNAAVFYLLEIYGIIKNKRLFLQHGITISNAKWLYYENTKMAGFVCGAEPEYEDIKVNYGYPENAVKYVGFTRFDNLHNINVNKKQILVMPSWREWLVLNTKVRDEFGEGDNFETSEYYKEWNKLLNDKKLHSFLEKNDLTLVFYPHRNIQNFINLFDKTSDNIVFANWQNYDIQQLLIQSAFLLTDYSSVFMDFSYMRKPSAYFQFDYAKFRKGQYEEGYFDYRDGFGEVFEDSDKFVEILEKSYLNDFKLDSYYEEKISKFFPLYDANNCERNYQFAKELLNK